MGFCRPGVAPPLGAFNDSIAYGATNAQRNLSDWYRVKFTEPTKTKILVDDFEVLDLSATYRVPVGGGMALVRIFGTDILEDGGRIARPFDAGSFAFASLVPRRTFGATVSYEF